MKLPINRSWLILLVALAVGGLAAFGVNRYIKRQMADIEARAKSTRTVRVVVPKSDLARGTVLSTSMVAVREVPAEWAHSNAITPEQFDKVDSQKLAYPATGGEMLMWSQLEGQRAPSFSSRLPSGRRAITVPVDEVNSISGMVEPGDRIDMVVSVKKDQRTVLFPLLQNVPVLATGARATSAPGADGKQTTYTTITLEASPEDAQRVLAAREIGRLAAVLRAPGDDGRTSSARRDAFALLGVDDAPPRPLGSTVPVLYGGRGGTLSIEPLRAPGAPQRAEPADEPAPRTPTPAASAAAGPSNRTTTDSRR